MARWYALRTRIFWALAVCFTAYYATFAALTFHLVPLMTERRVSTGLILTTMAIIGPAQVLARVMWFTVGRNVPPSIVGIVITIAFPALVGILVCAGTSPILLILFAIIYGGANGMMTIVQDVMSTEGYGAVSRLLSMPSNLAKGIAPISAAAIWTISGNYLTASARMRRFSMGENWRRRALATISGSPAGVDYHRTDEIVDHNRPRQTLRHLNPGCPERAEVNGVVFIAKQRTSDDRCKADWPVT